MVDLSHCKTTEECLLAADDWLSESGTAEDVIQLVGTIRAKTGDSVEIVSSALAIIFNENGEILLLHRSLDSRSNPDQLSFPGGQLEEQDINLAETVMRETMEETNLDTVLKKYHSTRFTAFGQRKRIGHIEFYELSLKNNQQQVKLSDEHTHYFWALPKDILADPKKYPLAGRIILQDILRSFLP